MPILGKVLPKHHDFTSTLVMIGLHRNGKHIFKNKDATLTMMVPYQQAAIVR